MNTSKPQLLVDLEALRPLVSLGKACQTGPLRFDRIAVRALEKLFRQGWEITFYTTRSRQQYALILCQFQLYAPSIWALASPHPLLIREKSLEDPEKIKLSLLETHFGKIIDNRGRLITIEPSQRWVTLIRNHTRGRVESYTAPAFWRNLLAVDKPYLLAQSGLRDWGTLQVSPEVAI